MTYLSKFKIDTILCVLGHFQLFVTLWTVACQAQEMIYVIFLLERWVLNHNMGIVKIVHSPSNLFIYVFFWTDS